MIRNIQNDCGFLTYLAVLFSMPVYLWNLIRPERVPKNAVSTPSSILKERDRDRDREREKEEGGADRKGQGKYL